MISEFQELVYAQTDSLLLAENDSNINLLTSFYRGEMRMNIAKRIAKWFRGVFSSSHSDPAARRDQHQPGRRARRWVTLR